MKQQGKFWSMLATLMLALLTVSFVSCGDDEPEPFLSVSPSSANFKVAGGSKTFDIETNVGWKAVLDEDWIELNKTKGDKGETVTISVDENETFKERRGTITIQSTTGGLSEKIAVTQSGKTAQLSVDKSSLSFKTEGESQTVNITSNLKWRLQNNNSWISVSPNTGEGSMSVTITAESNGGSERTATLTIEPTETEASSVTLTIIQKEGELSVSPTSASLRGEEGSSTNISVTTSGDWQLRGCPEWLHATATSGRGNTTITFSALSENFSDEARSATLTFTAGSKSISATISQAGLLPTGLRVETSNMVLMSDGFACDLKFGSRAKGYREAFFTEAAVRNLTERDIYNMLMEEDEYAKTADYTFSPVVDPNTTFYYCVASFGNENNADGTHKYGPMTMFKVTTPGYTTWADMPIYGIAYTDSEWRPITQKQGALGTRCSKYYYFEAEGESADILFVYSMLRPYAVLPYLWYNNWIAQAPNNYAISPQTFYFSRKSDSIFFGTWGVDDNNKFSNELMFDYTDLSSDEVKPKVKKAVPSSKWNQRRTLPSKADLKAKMKNIKVVRAL